MEAFTDPFFLTVILPMALFIIIFIPLSNRHWNKQEQQEIEDKKKKALRAIIHDDISSESNNGRKSSLKLRLLEHYCKDEITPELIAYFEDNYMETLDVETKRLAEQKAIEEQKELELDNRLNTFEQRKATQLEAFKSVKGLSPQKNREAH